MSADKQKSITAERIGERIRSLRTSRGFTQKSLAGDTVSRNMLSMIESGNALPSIDTLIHFAEALEVPPGYFFAEEEEIMLYGKNEAKDNVYELFGSGKYADAAEICMPFSQWDQEMCMYLTMCYLRTAENFLKKFMLTSADKYISAARDSAAHLSLGGDSVILVCDFIKLLTEEVARDSVPDLQSLTVSRAKNILPSDFIAYLCAYRSLKEGDPESAAAIARSGLLDNFHSLHIRGAYLMATDDPLGATRLFDLALSSDNGGFYSRYKLLCDLEFCHKSIGDFEAAYAMSTGRMEMLGMFSK